MGTPLPPPQKGGRPPIFGPCLLRPNGWVDEAGTWHGGRPQLRRLCVRWGPRSPFPRGADPQFSAHFYCGQTAGCVKMPLDVDVSLSPGDFVLDENPVPLPKRGGPPMFGSCSLWPNDWMDQDGTWHGARPNPRRLCVTWRPSTLPKRGRCPSQIFRPFLLWRNGWMH